jgi:hypothetical protein
MAHAAGYDGSKSQSIPIFQEQNPQIQRFEAFDGQLEKIEDTWSQGGDSKSIW